MDGIWIALARAEQRTQSQKTELACSRLLNEQLKLRIESERSEKRRLEEDIKSKNRDIAELERKLDEETRNRVKEVAIAEARVADARQELADMRAERIKNDEGGRKKDEAIFAIYRDLQVAQRQLQEIQGVEGHKKQKLRAAHRVLSQSFDPNTMAKDVAMALSELRNQCMSELAPVINGTNSH